ncbi:MAG: hypothetical protein P4N59_01000 [Negativicutes bacterium]|nr:hypothetical protein [Negativicutes bacterium]
MKLLAKKTIVVIAASTFILAGVAAPFMVYADQSENQRPAFSQRHVDPDKAATRLSETYGIDKATVINYFNQGVGFHTLSRAAFLAEASGKPLDDVLALKTADNSWRDVAKTLNITREQMKATRNNLTSNRLSTALGLDKQTTLGLFDQGYKARDVAMAGLLAQNTDQSIDNILSMKKINNSWRDVATTLGVDQDTLKQDMQKMHQAFPRGHKHHHA